MTTISSSASIPAVRPRPASAESRQAAKDLAVALLNEDLPAARQAFAQVVKNAPEGSTWNPDGPVARIGRALVRGDIAGAREAAKAALQGLRPELPALPPAAGDAVAPASVSTTGGMAGTLLNVVA